MLSNSHPGDRWLFLFMHFYYPALYDWKQLFASWKSLGPSMYLQRGGGLLA